MVNENFEQWAIVEIFGHQRIAGKVSEQVIGGCSFVRVDVPATENIPSFTKLYGNGAIYAMTFVDEETARGAVDSFREKPIDEFSARRLLGMLPDKIRGGQSVAVDDEPDDDDDMPF